MTKARKKVKQDFIDQKDETLRMRKDKRMMWKILGYINVFHYWIIGFHLPISLLIFLITQDYWKALAFLVYAQVYSIAGNLRGLGLHVENLVEWTIDKKV